MIDVLIRRAYAIKGLESQSFELWGVPDQISFMGICLGDPREFITVRYSFEVLYKLIHPLWATTSVIRFFFLLRGSVLIGWLAGVRTLGRSLGLLSSLDLRSWQLSTSSTCWFLATLPQFLLRSRWHTADCEHLELLLLCVAVLLQLASHLYKNIFSYRWWLPSLQ